jgi:hypothetical protein
MHEVVKQIVDSVPEFAVSRKEILAKRGDEPRLVVPELMLFALDEYRAGRTQKNSPFARVLSFLDSVDKSRDPTHLLVVAAALELANLSEQEYRDFMLLVSRDFSKLARSLKRIVNEEMIREHITGLETLRRLRAYVPEFEDFAKAENSEDWELPTVMFACLVRFIVEQYRQGRTSSESPFSRTLEFLEDIARSNDKYAVNLVWTGFLESLHVAGADYEGIVSRFGEHLRRLLRKVV